MTPNRNLVLVLLASLAVQLVYLAQSKDDPTFDRPIVDAYTYHVQAQQLASEETRAADPYFHPPLYPHFLAAVYRVLGPNVLSAKIVQIGLGVLTCLVTYLAARRLFPARVALLATALLALYGPLVFFQQQLLPAGLATLLNVTFLWLLLRAMSSRSSLAWLLAGGAAGLAALTVPNVLLVVAAVGLGFVVVAVRRRSGRVGLRLAFLALGLGLAVFPVTLRNYVVAKEWVLISTNGGINLYIGNNPRASETVGARPGFEWQRLQRNAQRNGVESPTAADRYFRQETLDYLREDPLGFLQGLGRKTGRLLAARELPRNQDLYAHAEHSSLLKALVFRLGGFALPFGLVAPLALLGIVTSLKGGRGRLVAAGIPALYALSIVLFFVSSRYRVVLAPPLVIFAAHGVHWIGTREAKWWVAGVALVAVAAALVNRSVASPADATNFAAEMHTVLGHQSLVRNDLGAAEEELRRALQIDPESDEAHDFLGVVRLRESRWTDAIEHLSRATTINPTFAEAHVHLGDAWAGQDSVGRAIAQYEKAVAIDPMVEAAHFSLGAQLLKRGDVAQAIQAFQVSTRTEPWRHEPWLELAWIRAAHPEETFRNGVDAVTMAKNASILGKGSAAMAEAMDALAAALAESGRFPEAVSMARRGIALCRETGDVERRNAMNARLGHYEKGIPYRRPLTGSAVSLTD
jgi:4-amino-4-deoxy-L-arabinose transferase-like glycosyltransferase